MSLQWFDLVCMEAAVIGYIRTDRLARRLLIICSRIDAPVTFDRRTLASCNSSKRLLQALADYFDDIAFKWLKSSGGCVSSPDSAGDLRAVVIR